MAERRDYKPGPLAKTAAAREYSHMRKVLNDRNRRQTQAQQEETRRRKAEERAERAREAAEAKRVEEEERERLRQNRRASLPRTASTNRETIIDEPPGRGERLPYAGGARIRLSGRDISAGDIAAQQAENANADALRRAIAGVEVVHPQPRGGPAPNRPTGAFQTLMEAMMNPLANEDENVQPAVVLNAIIQNQLNLAQQNACIMKALTNRHEVRLQK